MTPAAAKASYRRQMDASGETVLFRRAGVSDASVMARLGTYQPSDLPGAAQQFYRRAIVLSDDLVASGFPLPLKPAVDRIVVAGKVLAILAIDDTSRRVGGVLIAYELRIAGA